MTIQIGSTLGYSSATDRFVVLPHPMQNNRNRSQGISITWAQDYGKACHGALGSGTKNLRTGARAAAGRKTARPPRRGGIETPNGPVGRSGDHRADPLPPALALFASRALRDPPMDRHEPHRLFGQVVGRFDLRVDDEAKVACRMPIKAFFQIQRLFGVRRFARRVPHQIVFDPLQRTSKGRVRSELAAAMDGGEQRFQVSQQPFAVGFVPRIGMFRQELYVADEMRQAELQQDILVQAGVLAVGAEIVAPQQSGELAPQGFQQHVRAARRRDLEHGMHGRPETPRPQPLARILVAGFIHVEQALVGQAGQEIGIGRLHAGAHLLHELRQLPAADGNVHHVAEELADGGKRHVAGPLEKADQRRQLRPAQARVPERMPSG